MPRVNFWIVKGNPRYPLPGVDERNGNLKEFLMKGITWSNWITYKKVPEICHKGDPVFFWSSGKLRAIVGLGTIKNPNIDGHEFHLNHISQRLLPTNLRVGIEEISSAFKKFLLPSECNAATYIKPCVVSTIYPVTSPQARIIIKLLLQKQQRYRTLETHTLREWFAYTGPESRSDPRRTSP